EYLVADDENESGAAFLSHEPRNTRSYKFICGRPREQRDNSCGIANEAPEDSDTRTMDDGPSPMAIRPSFGWQDKFSIDLFVRGMPLAFNDGSTVTSNKLHSRYLT
ncbi:hypothetical protein PV326_001204, partial [Microctonus aethiopoides]